MWKHKIELYALALSASLVGACTSTPPRDFTYEVPQDVPTVPLTLLVKGDSRGIFGTGEIEVLVFEPVTCVVSPWGLRLATLAETSVPTPRSQDVRLAAGSSLVLTFVDRASSGMGRSACPYSIQFQPQDGFDYQAAFHRDEGWCRAAVHRKPNPSPESEWEPDPTTQPTPICLDARSRQRYIQDFGD